MPPREFGEATRDTLAELDKGAWPGTADLLEQIAAESRFAYTWKPMRAALLIAARDLQPHEGPIWSGDRFAQWEAEAKLLAKARGDGRPRDRLGFTADQARKMRAEGVEKVRVLACAHYTLGLPQPVPAGDVRTFEDWFYPRFKSANAVAPWLGVSVPFLNDRLRGFATKGADRTPREPEAWLIRALDWVATVGPLMPYPDKPSPAVWPDQDLDEGGGY
jgi:hypothetical protein